MKKNIDYYPHKSNSHLHPKFKMLRGMYKDPVEGWAAEGRFWALNNIIASSEDCVLDLSKRRNRGVFADELGMSIGEFDQFIDLLKSEDIELISQIDTDIYTTDKVKETYEDLSEKREKAKERKSKNTKSESSQEKTKSSGEPSKSSGEPNNKLNKTELKGTEENKRELIGEQDLNFLKSNFSEKIEKIKKLFQQHTKIQDPNEEKILLPIVQLYAQIPEGLSAEEIGACIEEQFKRLNREQGFKIDFFLANVRGSISKKWEQVKAAEKRDVLSEAQEERKKAILLESEKKKQELAEVDRKLIELGHFYEENKQNFAEHEKAAFLDHIKNRRVLKAEMLIERVKEKVA